MNIDELIKEATKEKSENLGILRLIKNEFLVLEKSGKFPSGLEENDKIKILQKMADQRKESIRVYKENGRTDLAEQEEKELKFIAEFLPDIPDPDTIKDTLIKIMSEFRKDNGLTKLEMKNLKPIMSQVQKIYPGIQGKIISELYRSLI